MLVKMSSLKSQNNHTHNGHIIFKDHSWGGDLFFITHVETDLYIDEAFVANILPGKIVFFHCPNGELIDHFVIVDFKEFTKNKRGDRVYRVYNHTEDCGCNYDRR